ncbi:ladinin-1 isoform X1 [Notolabrus celidotus]|uniref:ladinin-1 isoform X1 n=1 Tax=Notolabrus celidotus TaxID=1203425 RepID=UPI0014907D70|nr:ladinin-1 isoform X1 [Notolabrus celidotus]
MSISRKNWSALSSLARQWTMEDEEEVEREKRRRVKSSADPDSDASETRRDTPTSDSIPETDSSSETSQGLNSVDQMQLDFVEMLRVRDEKRRIRHVETLRKQKEVGEDEGETCSGGARVELLGDLDVDEGSVFPPVQATKPQPPVKTTSYSPTNSNSNSRSSSTSTNITNRQHENGESTGKAPDPKPPSNPARKFVSSVSISLDRSPSVSGCTSPISPRSPKAPLSPGEHWPSPCQSPSSRDAQSPVQNGHTHETGKNGSPSSTNFEQTSKPAFVRQSSRTISFRMMRKKEEETSPLQRSASVRMASKKFEPNTDQNDNEDSAPSLQRNSRQRISSRSIKEKMERLAQAAQKSDVVKSPDVTQRTLHLLDEVSRKRGLFEKEQQATAPTSPGVSRQEFRNFASGMSDRINRWLNKGDQTGSSHSPTDLRHVDITSMRSMFESRAEGSVPETTPAKIYK